MNDTLIQSLQISCRIEPDDQSLDCNDSLSMLNQDSLSMLFHKKTTKSLADSDTFTTAANSSFASSYQCSTIYECPSPVKKSVRFVLDKHDEPLALEYESEGPLTADEKASMWWQPTEFKLFRKYCRKAAEVARNSAYPDEFTKVYDACATKSVTDMTELSNISRAHIRGLEAVVFPALVQARKLVVKGVIKTQEKLASDMTYEQRARILSATSRCLTGRARLLARVFGVGDEEVAKDCYYSMSKNKSS